MPVDSQNEVSLTLDSTSCVADSKGIQFSLMRSWNNMTSESLLSNKEAPSDNFMIADEHAVKNGCCLISFKLALLAEHLFDEL